MFDFYQNARKPEYRLIVRRGAQLPAEAAGEEWVLRKIVEKMDDKATAEVEAKGYYHYRMDGVFEEKVVGRELD
jgi:hypothetical protein